MSTRELVFPHQVVDGISLRVSNPLDSTTGQPIEKYVVYREDEIGQERWDFIDAKPKWGGLEIDLELSLAPEQFAQILPDPTAASEETAAIVSVMCAATNYRRGVRLKPRTDGGWRGALFLPREDVYGLVELSPTVVRIKDAPPGTDPDFATFAGAIIATGKAIQLVLDKPARRYDGSMEYVWEDFAQSANPWRKARKDDVFHIEPAETPVMYLNLRWPFLKPLLEFEGRHGTGAAMRDLTAAIIAQGGWAQLFTIAIASIQSDGESHFVAGEAWRKDLASLMVNQLYAGDPAEERLALAYEEWNEPAAVGSLVARISAVAQSRATLGKLMDRAAKAMETVAAIGSE